VNWHIFFVAGKDYKFWIPDAWGASIFKSTGLDIKPLDCTAVIIADPVNFCPAQHTIQSTTCHHTQCMKTKDILSISGGITCEYSTHTFQDEYMCICKIMRPPLWSSSQCSWLQIQRSRFDSRRNQIFWEIVVLERGPLSLVRITEELLEWKSGGFGLENRY
jgi:hypothetical protein